ncbi:MAG: hypothetical protein A2X86_18735 [Bdellovibrionales bacterium GWA2_49_15]|nr:MAG: hypothetical protein A2X86_18735 [Bdellovibrionales bacterium GWA2_49_15]HAZ14263.1 hypothetical protein [Bdellovibrionales bacterium]
MRFIHVCLLGGILAGAGLVYFIFFRTSEDRTLTTKQGVPLQYFNTPSVSSAKQKSSMPTSPNHESDLEKAAATNVPHVGDVIDSPSGEAEEVVKITKDAKGQDVVWLAPSNPIEVEMPAASSEEVKRKINEADRLWEKEMDHLFTPNTPEMRELRREYQKMQQEFLRNRFPEKPQPTEEEKNKSQMLSKDEMDDDAKYIQDYSDRLRHLLGEEMYKQYEKRRTDFMKKAITEGRFPIDF